MCVCVCVRAHNRTHRNTSYYPHNDKSIKIMEVLKNHGTKDTMKEKLKRLFKEFYFTFRASLLWYERNVIFFSLNILRIERKFQPRTGESNKVNMADCIINVSEVTFF